MAEDEKLVAYASIKAIVETTEALKTSKYKEAIENNWMSDYTEYATHMELEAYEKIKDLAKD